jgi:putrescine transport system permease protein
MGIFGIIILYLPLLNMIYNSFSLSLGGVTEFTCKWYGMVWRNKEIMECFWTSFSLAALAATLSILIAIFFCFCRVLINHPTSTSLSKKWLSFFELQIQLPLLLSDTIYGLGMMLFFFCFEQILSEVFFFSSFTKILVAHATFGVGFVYVLLKQKVDNSDFSIQEAALDLGIPPHIMFCGVVLPSLYTPLVIGWFFVFLISLDDIIMTSLIGSGSFSTLPQYILSTMKLSVSPVIDALSCLMMLFAFFIITMSLFFFNTKSRK